MARRLALIGGIASLLLACAAPRATRSDVAEKSSLVLIHTADLHSHLFPERQLIGSADAARGLGPRGEIVEVGGFARIARIVSEIRAGAQRSLYLDSGDLVEGTAAFNEFGGEPELRAFSALGLGAAALGNHDLSPGAEAFARSHRQFANFPVLASNIADNGSELAAALAPSAVLDAGGIKVGVIGVANPTSPSGLDRSDNPYGIELVASQSALQAEVDRLRPQVDLVIAISHLGLAGDQRLIAETSGLDVVLGGHQHLALDVAQQRLDCGARLAAERGCNPRPVVLIHSGALGRYVGELDLDLAPTVETAGTAEGVSRLSVVSAEHSLIPVTADSPDDPALTELLEPYRERLEAAGFNTKLAFALGSLERYAANGGDSALGDLVTDAMRAHTGADFALLNTTAIRADLPAGELARAAFVAALPFADTLTELTLDGAQLRALFNQQARVASERECQSPIQISGLELTLQCSGVSSSALARIAASGRELDARTTYTVVTSSYLADGASGFDSLTDASSRRELELDVLHAVLEAVSSVPSCAASPLPCLDPPTLRDHRITVQPG